MTQSFIVGTGASLVRSGMFVAIASAAAAASAQAAQPAAPGQQPVASAQQVVAVTPVPSPLASIPGVTVTYYDVTGTTVEALNASIAAQRPKDPVTGRPLPSSATWSIGVSVKRATTGTVCKLTEATPSFKGEVILPRLVNPETVPEPVRNHWAAYVASMEQRQAETLRRPFSRLGEVRTAVMASSCDGASDAANRAITEITKAPAPIVAPAATAVTPTP